MRTYQVAHRIELWRIQHGLVASRLLDVGIKVAAVFALGLLVYGATDIVVNHLEYEGVAEREARECFAVLNGDVKMVDKDTGEVARVTWSRVDLIGENK